MKEANKKDIEANKIARYFIKLTAGRATPAIMKRTHAQAKSLLNSGYDVDEVMEVIDYLINVKQANIYSLGYVSACINDVLKVLKQNKEREAEIQARKNIKEMESQQERSEVRYDEQSSERNKGKSERFGIQSRFRTQLDFDLLEGE